MSDTPPSPQMDASALWREETYTDRKIGAIRRLSPVKADGSADLARKTLFIGEATLMTPAGSLPLTFEIPAEDLAQAVAGYGKGLEKAYQETLAELQELQRRASSKIVIPKGGMPPDSGPGGLMSKLKL